ncbi:MAG: DUF937 domain-containing protein [Pyrinomonadaceae bacterium]
MFSLHDLLGQQQGDEALGQISQQVGAEPSLVNTAIQAALPAILGGLANNASTPDGAQSLDNALSNDHTGGLLDNLGGLGSLIFGGQQAAPPPRQADAGGILGHILGTNEQNQVAQQASRQSGLPIGQVAQIIMMLAPLVMSYLGQQKQQQKVGADGLGGLIGSVLGGAAQAAPQSSGNAMLDMASSVLDRDHDGSAMDDIASMAFNYVTGK